MECRYLLALIAEQPDGYIVLLNFDGPNRDFLRISGNWHEARVHTELLGDRVTLACAWLGERRLGCGVVLDMELEIDSVANFGLDLIRPEYVLVKTVN